MTVAGAKAAPSPGFGLAGRIVAAWAGPRASSAALLAERPREARLMGFVAIACLVLFAAGALRDFGPATPAAEAAARFVALVIFGPLFFYGVAAVARVAARAFGGSGGWYETRLATFWAMLVAAPLMLGAALIGRFVGMGGVADGVASGGAAWIWSAMLAEAHGFRLTAAVFAMLLVIVVTAAAALGLLLRNGG